MADLRTVLRIIARDETKGALTKTQKELKGIGTTLGDLRNQALALAGINFGIGGLASLVALADGYALTTQRLKLLSGETEDFAELQNQVFDIAQATFSTYEQTASLYGNLAASTKAVGVTQKELLTVTKALNQAYKITGSTQQEAAAATIQLIQALASGQIRGQEFNSVAEQGRRILFALKDATGKTAGELREFANAGKLTTEFFLEKFLPEADKINEEFNQLPLTVGRSLTQLQNAFQRYVGEENIQLGATRDIAEVFRFAANNFQDFADVVITSGGLVVAFLSGQFAQSVKNSIATIYADTAAKAASARASLAKAQADNVAAKASITATRAAEARILVELAQEKATLNAARTLGIAGGQRIALERRVIALTSQYNAAVQARVAADARFVASQNAVKGAMLGTVAASRLLGTVVGLFGGWVGLAVTVATVAASFFLLGDSIDEANESTGDFNETADRLLGNLDEIKRRELQAGIELGEREIASIEARLKVIGAAVQVERDVARVTKLREEQLALEEREIVLGDKLLTLRNRLAEVTLKNQGKVTKGTATIATLVKAENDSLKKLANERQKLAEDLDKINKRLTGPQQADITAQSDAANITALNRLRASAQQNIEEGDVQGAVDDLSKARDIVVQLEKTGGATSFYLKSQIALVKQLTEDLGEVPIEKASAPKIDEESAATNLNEYAALRDEFLEQNPGKELIAVDLEGSNSNLVAATQARQSFLNENPLYQAIITDGTKTLTIPADAQANAAGGYIRGPGSGTSDSILSWLSNGEFVVRAAAVQHYGADLLKRLNSMTLPRFASGGPVRVPAASAPAASGAPIIFNLNGQQYEATISGGGAGDLRNALKRENMRRGTRA